MTNKFGGLHVESTNSTKTKTPELIKFLKCHKAIKQFLGS